MGKYEQLARDIIKDVGGQKNIISVVHCITRLRFKLRDEKKADTADLKQMDGVVTAMQSGGQYQVVIGNHVSDVYKDVLAVSGLSESGGEGGSEGTKGSLLDRFIDMISGVIQPLMTIMCATGMIKGLAALLTFSGLVAPDSGTATLLSALGDCFFYFFPVFLGYTAAKKFGVAPFVGMAIGAALVYPTISDLNALEPIMVLFQGTILESHVTSTFLGLPLIMPTAGYASTVIPAIVALAAAAPVERFLKKIIPDVVKNFLVPFFTLLIIVPITFLIIGPITSWLSDLIGAGVTVLYSLSPIITGVVLAGLWQVMVIFGLHWGVVPIAINNLATLKADVLLALIFGASFAQLGVVIAIAIKTKDKKLRTLTIPAIISAIFGVTEPAIYGITLPRKKTFAASCVAAAISGGLIGFLGIKMFSMGGLGIFGYPTYVSAETGVNFMPQMLLCTGVAMILGIILGFVTFKDSEAVLENPGNAKGGTVHPTTDTGSKVTVETLLSPVAGTVIPLSAVDDPVFSTGAMGKGIAVSPTENFLYAPADGVVTAFMDTGHAVGLRSDKGVEVLIHVGMDTVQLGGKHFTPHIQQNDAVKKGQLLLEFDREAIEKEGYSTLTPIVITNSDQYLDVLETDAATVTEKDVLLRMIR